MAMYGKIRDVNLIKSINSELIKNIIEQQIGYYKPKIDQLNINVYGESTEKFWSGPVLIPLLIQRGDNTWKTDEFGSDSNRTFEFRFFKDHLVDAGVIPEVGDVVLFNEDFYEVDGVNENRLIVGKDPDYAYSTNVTEFGASLSIILSLSFIENK